MKNFWRIFVMFVAACAFGITANLAVADSDAPWHRGMGPGMMGGYGMGPGMMGGYGMGPGMMGGYGMGPGMMGGYGMGPGMMGGYGMGPGMMGGYGMGPGMMGYGEFHGLNLSSDQKSRIAKIRKAMRTKNMALMNEMMDAREKLQELYDADKQDAAAINKQYKTIEDLRRQMVDSSVDAHNQISDILTKEQRDKLREGRRGYGPMMW